MGDAAKNFDKLVVVATHVFLKASK